MFDFLNEKDRQPPALPEGTVRRRYSIEGQVQGVGFRYRARYAAQSLGLTGWVENEDDGSVTLEVQGVRPHPAQRLYPDYFHPPARPRPRPMGAGFPGARLLVNASYKHEAPRSPAFRGAVVHLSGVVPPCISNEYIIGEFFCI